MQIVIDIPKEYIEHILDGKETFLEVYDLVRRVANGTTLPKGHGALKDADMLMNYCQNQKAKTVDCNDIARFPTIIEADKEKQYD